MRINTYKSLYKRFKIYFIIILVFLGIVLNPTISRSQSNPSQLVPVEIDGQEIFQINGSPNLNAQERADWIESQLETIVESDEPPDIRIETRNNSPVMLINDRYLLTVTQDDATAGQTPEEQALTWATQIRSSIEQAQKERSTKFLWRQWLQAFLVVGLALALHWFLADIWKRLGKVVTFLVMPNGEGEEGAQSESQSNASEMLDKFLNSTLVIARVSLWIGVSLYVSNLFPLTKRWSETIRGTIIGTFTNSIITVGNNSYSITDLLVLIILFIALIIIGNKGTKFLRCRVLQYTRISDGVQEAIAVVSKYIFIAISTIVLLQVWGFDLSSLTILASTIGVAVGFGFQNIAKNFGSGLVLLFERPIRSGDFVEVAGYTGTIEYIGARSTVIRTLDNISIIVPNSRFLESEVINWSHRNPVSRIHLPVGVAYHSDVNVVRDALLEAAKECPNVLPSPAPQVFFKAFGDSALDFELLVWIVDPSKSPVIQSQMYFLMEASLRKYEIEIPFPQRDLHLRSGELPIGMSSQMEDTILKLSQGLSNGKKPNLKKVSEDSNGNE